jgi:hypothetical protein
MLIFRVLFTLLDINMLCGKIKPQKVKNKLNKIKWIKNLEKI